MELSRHAWKPEIPQDTDLVSCLAILNQTLWFKDLHFLIFVGITDLEVGSFTGAQTAHPEIGQDDLAAGVGEERPVIRCDGEGKARLAGPVFQLRRKQLLCLVVVLPVAEVQQLYGCWCKEKNWICCKKLVCLKSITYVVYNKENKGVTKLNYMLVVSCVIR